MVATPQTESPAAARSYPERDHPDVTPRTERLPTDFDYNEHTAETWEAYITSPAVAEANAIFDAAKKLRDQLDRWVKKYGRSNDPGAAAIKAAGLPLPAPVAEGGTDMRYVRDQLAGLAWATAAAVSNLDVLPFTDAPENNPANVRRLLGLAGQG